MSKTGGVEPAEVEKNQPDGNDDGSGRDDGVLSSESRNGDGGVVVVSFAELQRMRIHKLQVKLTQQAIEMHCTGRETEEWEEILGEYGTRVCLLQPRASLGFLPLHCYTFAVSFSSLFPLYMFIVPFLNPYP